MTAPLLADEIDAILGQANSTLSLSSAIVARLVEMLNMVVVAEESAKTEHLPAEDIVVFTEAKEDVVAYAKTLLPATVVEQLVAGPCLEGYRRLCECAPLTPDTATGFYTAIGQLTLVWPALVAASIEEHQELLA